MARPIGARDVIAELEKLFDEHGKPVVLRSDNSREFIAETLGKRLAGGALFVAAVFGGFPWVRRTCRAGRRGGFLTRI